MGKVAKKKTAALAVSKLKKPLASASNLKKKTGIQSQPEPTDGNAHLRRKQHVLSDSKVTKKKDRMKLKKESLKKKLVQGAKKSKEEAAKKNREKVPVVGDMKPLTESLKTIHEFLAQEFRDKPAAGAAAASNGGLKKNTESKEVGKKGVKQKPMKQKARKAQFQRDLQIFSQVKKHPEFMRDPMAIISTHIENKMLMEANELEGQ